MPLICAIGERAECLERVLRESSFGAAFKALSGDFTCEILLFDSCDDRVGEWIGRAADDASRRVLAVDVSERQDSAFRWKALAAGASDVLGFAENVDHLSEEIATRIVRWRKADQLLRSAAVSRIIIGTSPRWIKVLRDIVEIAAFTSAPMLVTGETGTGKELIARLVHSLDAREPKREHVVVDCSAIDPALSGSEFFGHEKGAYTGASLPRVGAFALAHGGTLFLDEIGELPIALQAKLLRVVQERTYKPLGSNVWRETDFRLVCATNRDLIAEAAVGTFRRDLY